MNDEQDSAIPTMTSWVSPLVGRAHDLFTALQARLSAVSAGETGAILAELVLKVIEPPGTITGLAVNPRRMSKPLSDDSGASGAVWCLPVRVAGHLLEDEALRQRLRLNDKDQVQRVLMHCHNALQEFYANENFQSLRQLPARRENHWFYLHYDLSSYPAYLLFSAVWQQALYGEQQRLRGYALEQADKHQVNFCTPLRRLVQDFPSAAIRDSLIDYEDEELLAIIDQVLHQARQSHRSVPLAWSTQQQYRHVLVRVLQRHFPLLVYQARSSRERTTSRDDPDGDPPEDTADREHYATQEYIRQFTAEEGAWGAAATEEVQAVARLYHERLSGTQQPLTAAEYQARAYWADRAFMARYAHPYDPRGVDPNTLALVYVEAVRPCFQDPVTDDFNDWANLLALDCLVHLGWPLDHLLTLEIGPAPGAGAELATPRYVPEQAAIYYVPQIYPAAPAGFASCTTQPRKAGESGESLVPLYEPVAGMRVIPLSPVQHGLFQVYLSRRARILTDTQSNQRSSQPTQLSFLRPAEAIAASAQAGPLLVLAVPDLIAGSPSIYVRRMQPTDIRAWLDQIQGRIAQQIPHASRLLPRRLAHSFRSYYVGRYNLDPVLAHCVCDYHALELHAPLFYTRVRLELLRERYWAAQARFRDDLHAASSRLGHPLPNWPHIEVPSPGTESEAFGSRFVPVLDRVRETTTVLMCAASWPPSTPEESIDPARHTARSILAVYMLSLLAGLRIGEVTGLQYSQIDLCARRLAVAGKSDRFYEEHRLVPIPTVLVDLLKDVLSRSFPEAQPQEFAGAAFWCYDDRERPQALTPERVRQSLERLSRTAGVVGALPRYHSTRHFLRTFLFERGLSFEAINIVLGHGAAGGEFLGHYGEARLANVCAEFETLAYDLAAVTGFVRREDHGS